MTSALPPFEELEHVADVALRVLGRDWGELLVNAAVGMFNLIAHADGAPLSSEHHISLTAEDSETLLVDWLSELLYLHEMEGEVYFEFEMITTSPTSLRAIARGTDQWSPGTVIKAVTFNDLQISSTDSGLAVTIVFDT
jgi:SHS2 domain-containing protein